MGDIIAILTALQDTPVPLVLVAAGIAFLLLAFAGAITAHIKVPPERQKWVGGIGVLLLIAGVSLYMLPSPVSKPSPADITVAQNPTLAESETATSPSSSTSSPSNTAPLETTEVPPANTVTASHACTPSPYSELPLQAIAVIEPDNGTKSEVRLNSLEYEKSSGLKLASGRTIDFRRMKNFELLNKVFSPHYTADVVITFLDCTTYQDVIKSESGSLLTGEAEFGPLELNILNVERVDFQW